MFTRQLATAIACIALFVFTTANASAVDLFFEDFEDYSVPGDTNPGKPLVSEGAKETWFGGRWETPNDGTIDQDLAIRELPGVYPNNNQFAQFEDDAGIMFNISTLGVANPVLSFEWVTHLAETTDRFVAGYYVGTLDTINDTTEGSAEPHLIHDFVADGPSWSSSWVELLRDRQSNGFQAESYAIPGDTPSIWIAFWLDDGEGDYGKVDNIVVTPEPGAAALMLVGIAAGIVRRRRR